MTVFEDRSDAGRRLADVLADRPGLRGSGTGDGQPGDGRVVVLAIPRGGLPVGAEVARVLDADLDVAVIRKLRSPHNPELGFGAVGVDGQAVVDDELVATLGLTPEQVRAEIADRGAVVDRRMALYRAVSPPADLDGATVVVVDDGIATGGTAQAACLLARRMGAARIVLAVPVAPEDAVEELRAVADDVVVLSRPAEFLAVDQAYRDFAELDDDAAVAALAAVADARQRAPSTSK